MALAENEKTKKLLKLEEQLRKVKERKLELESQIRAEEDRIYLKMGKMTNFKKQQYQRMKQAYNMRQDGKTFVEIGQSLDLSASQVSILCQTYSVILEVLEKRNKT